MAVLDLISRLNRRFGAVLAWLALGALGVITIEIVMRHTLGAPTLWAHLTAITLVAIGFMFGGIRAFQDDEHVGLALHAWLIPARLDPWRRVVVDVIVCAYLAGFAVALWQQADRSIAIWETTGSAWRAPIPVVIKTAMAAATVLFAAESFGACVRSLRAALRPGRG